MTEFKAVDPEQVLLAVKAGVEGIADVLNRTFDGQFEVAPSDSVENLAGHGAAGRNRRQLDGAFGGSAGPGLDGPFLAIQGDLESGCAVAILPASAGLAPEWCASPDDTQQAKLGSLAQEFFFSTIPDDYFAVDQRFDYLTSTDSLESLAFDDSAQLIRIAIKSEAGEGELLLIWPSEKIVDLSALAAPSEPVADADESATAELDLLETLTQDADEPQDPPADQAANQAAQESSGEETKRIAYTDVANGIRYLPLFARSILKVAVPVQVVLAKRKMTVDELGELAPGSIIEFKKSHEETLTLEIDNHPMAEGEAVRVGEKFGLWITSVTLPKERFSVSNQK